MFPVEVVLQTCALTCGILLVYFGYLWHTGRREEAVGYLGSIAISLVTTVLIIMLLNAETIAELSGIPIEALDYSRAIDTVQHIVDVVSDRMKWTSGLMLALAYAELIAVIVGSAVGGPVGATTASGIAKAATMAQISSSLGVGMLKGLMYGYSWIMLLFTIVLSLLKIGVPLGFQLIAFSSCLLVAPRIRRMGITLIALGLVLAFALPIAVNLADLEFSLERVELSRIPPDRYGVLYVEGLPPYTLVVLEDEHIYSLQTNAYGRKLVLIPVGNYTATSTTAYWLTFEQNSRVRIFQLNAPITHWRTKDKCISDGVFYYRGNYSILRLDLPGDFIVNSTGVYGWGSIVEGKGRVSLLSVSTNGSLSYTMYFYINSSRIIFFVGNRPSIEILGYNINGSWRDTPVNFTLEYKVLKSSIRELRKYYNVSWVSASLLERLYSNYVEWYRRQYWLDEEYVRAVRKYAPLYPNPRVYIRPPIDEEEFREYANHRPPVYKVVVECRQLPNTTANPKWFASVRISMPPSRPWTFHPWMFYNPHTGLCKELRTARIIVMMEELTRARVVGESLLMNFVLLLLASDALAGMFGGVSLSGWLMGLLWKRVLSTIAVSTTAFVAALGGAISRSRVHHLVAKKLGFRIYVKYEPMLMRAKSALYPWKRMRDLRALERIRVHALAVEERLRKLPPRMRRTISTILATTGLGSKYTLSILRERPAPALVKVARDVAGRSKKIERSRRYYTLDRAYRIARATVWDIYRGIGRGIREVMLRKKFQEAVRKIGLEEVYESFRGRVLEVFMLRSLERRLPAKVSELESRLLNRLKEKLLERRPELADELRDVGDFYMLSKLTGKYDRELDPLVRYAGILTASYKEGVPLKSFDTLKKAFKEIEYLDTMYASTDRILDLVKSERVESPMDIARLFERRLAPPKERGILDELARRVLRDYLRMEPDDLLSEFLGRRVRLDIESLREVHTEIGYKEVANALRGLIDVEKLRMFYSFKPREYSIKSMLSALTGIDSYMKQIDEYVERGLLDPERGISLHTKLIRALKHPTTLDIEEVVNDIITTREEVIERITSTTDMRALELVGVRPLRASLDDCLLWRRGVELGGFLILLDHLKNLVEDVLKTYPDIKVGASVVKAIERPETLDGYDLTILIGEVKGLIKEIRERMKARARGVEGMEERAVPLVIGLREIAEKLEEYTVAPLPPFIFPPSMDEIVERIGMPRLEPLLSLAGVVSEYEKEREAIEMYARTGNITMLEILNNEGWVFRRLVEALGDEEVIEKVNEEVEHRESLSKETLERLREATRSLEDARTRAIWDEILSYEDVYRLRIPPRLLKDVGYLLGGGVE